MEDYDRSHIGKDIKPGSRFEDCECGSQVKLIDTNNICTMDTEAFLLFWYNKELGCISVVQHMKMTALGALELSELLYEWSLRALARAAQVHQEGKDATRK